MNERMFGGMFGKPLAKVTLVDDGDEIRFEFRDGSVVAFGVDGDCCSKSWIEHLEMPNDIVGAIILSAEESDTITSDHDEHDDENGGESIQVYNTRFVTDRGEIVLEYRNSSNGYYGGNLCRIVR